MMPPEANTHALYKERLLKATRDDTMVTKCYTGARLRVIRNPYTTKFEESPELLGKGSAEIARRAWADGCWRLHSGSEPEWSKGWDGACQAYVAGQNIGALSDLQPTAEIVRDMTETAARLVTQPPGVTINSKL